jgi:Lar family restriction alleviation protein
MSEPEPEPDRRAPCPFCGSARVYVVLDLALDAPPDPNRVYAAPPAAPVVPELGSPLYVECANCRARGPAARDGDDQDDALAAWNRRIAPTPSEVPTVPMIDLRLNGDGCWPDLREHMGSDRVIHLGNGAPAIGVALLRKGCASGAPSVMLRVELPDGRTVLAETTLALFTAAADAMRTAAARPG